MIIDFIKAKERKIKKKEIDDELARGRKPLYVSHLTGKVTANPDGKFESDNVDFGDRLQRIRASLDKINRLMAELKRYSNECDIKSNI